MDLDLDLIADSQGARQERRAAQERLRKLFKQVGRILSEIRRTLQACPDAQGDVAESLKVAEAQLTELLREEGVTVFGAVNDRFDPSRHHIQEVRLPAGPVCEVVNVEEVGLEWEGQVFQKAVVAVCESQRPATAKETQ